MAKRPTGVTLICILGFIEALVTIGSGLYAFFVGSVLSGIGAAEGAMGAIFGILGMVFSLVSLVPAVIGFLLLVAFYWLWNMKKSGWVIVVILQVLMLLFSLMGAVAMNPSSILSLALSAVIIYYLFKNKKLFK